MNKIETFTMQSPASDVLAGLTSDEFFSPVKVRDFAQMKGLQDDFYSFDQLRALLVGDMFKKIFGDKWQYETSSQWSGRNVDIAIRETILHSLVELAENAQLELLGRRADQFPESNKDQIRVFDKQAQFLVDYYRYIIKEAV